MTELSLAGCLLSVIELFPKCWCFSFRFFWLRYRTNVCFICADAQITYPGMPSMLPMLPMAPVGLGSSFFDPVVLAAADPTVLAAALEKIKTLVDDEAKQKENKPSDTTEPAETSEKLTDKEAKDNEEKSPTDLAQTIVDQHLKLRLQMLQISTMLDKLAADGATAGVPVPTQPFEGMLSK